MDIIKSIVGIVWTLGPGTKLPHILCAGIGPLQLGIVLVSIIFGPILDDRLKEKFLKP